MLESAQVAMPSSPVLRMSQLVTVELVTPPWKLMPSAVVSRMRMPENVRLVIGPSIQAPTFMCSIHTLDTVELLSAPPMPLYLVAVVALLDVAEDREVLQVDVRARRTVGPGGSARAVDRTAVEARGRAGDRRVPHTGAGDRHVVDAMWPGMLYVPGGIHTVPPAPAALIAELNAAVESADPGRVGALAGHRHRSGRLCQSAAPTFSKSAKSIVYDDAVSSESTCSLNVVPTG